MDVKFWKEKTTSTTLVRSTLGQPLRPYWLTYRKEKETSVSIEPGASTSLGKDASVVVPSAVFRRRNDKHKKSCD